jgi:hypothetical protein
VRSPYPGPGRMLIDQRGARARMTEARHQLLETCARGRGESAANVAEIMKMKPRQLGFRASGVPDGPKVGPAERGTFRADEASRAFSLQIVRLPAVVSRPPAASQTISCAEPGHDAHSPGFQRLREGRRTTAGISFPLRCRFAATPAAIAQRDHRRPPSAFLSTSRCRRPGPPSARPECCTAATKE